MNFIELYYRFHDGCTRQRIANGRWPLCGARMLFQGSYVQRNVETNECVGRFIQ